MDDNKTCSCCNGLVHLDGDDREPERLITINHQHINQTLHTSNEIKLNEIINRILSK